MSTTTMTSSTPNAKNSSKPTKQSRKVILRLPSKTLANFPSDSSPKEQDSSAASQAGTPKAKDVDKMSESNGTPLPTSVAEDTPDPESKKKGLNGPKTGNKRNSSTAALDLLKPKGRPGPKKKPRLADGTIDRSNDAPKPATAPTAATHKLNPKANTGAINANLRALDRSGKPTRKWQRKGFALKSFTGVNWAIGSWSAPIRSSSTFSGDVKSDSSSTGDIKPTMDSSALPSDSSRSGDLTAVPMNGVESSPAPIQV
ncbi:putative INO80 complex subunit Ies4 [Elsinoe australis]|uniref:Putative INO80 complex subunit Ies4 n=1 Tax=Elsinoe australis TaxID=40998 RepID=A0A4V6DU17_9PEZI|nr:putative INO80 complex subunit Ies4 [Elsinoe australis]